MATMTVQLRRKGVITLPIHLRREYGLDEGNVFTLTDLGDGSLLLIPGASQVARLGDRVARLMDAAGVELDAVLEALDEEREAYYSEHYAQAESVARQQRPFPQRDIG
jgi:bifunctional DNA-binding transcriptional regulator/antitoxin component of YhaV-PrlF toxin-antitoxin module